MEKPSKGSKCNGYFPRKNARLGSRSRRLPPRRSQIRTMGRRKQGRRIPKRAHSKRQTKESPHMLFLWETRSLHTGLPTEKIWQPKLAKKQPGAR
jgi:hypothetical protein